MIASQRKLLVRLAAISARIPHISQAIRPCTSAADEKLILRGDFAGISRVHHQQKKSQSPEIILSRIRDNLSRNHRISAEMLFTNVIQPLEAGDEALQKVLQNSGNHWLPMLIRSTGFPLSNVSKLSRSILLDRFWRQLTDRNIPITIEMFNARLKVLLENESEFLPSEELTCLQELFNLQPNQETFQHILEQLGRKGDIDSFRHMVYQMASMGCVVDEKCNTALVLCHAVRGHNAKADSLVEQTRSKYSEEAWAEAQGACARAAAMRGDTNRLRHILRYSVDKDKRLLIPLHDIFDTIWQLTSCSTQQQHNLISQIFDHVSRARGFFHLLIREIDRYISHQHYQTAIILLYDTNRIQDCLKNQQKSSFMNEAVSRMARSMIRNKIPVEQLHDIANRVSTIFKNNADHRIHDDLLYAALTFKQLSIDERIAYLKEFCEAVDPDRTRHQLILPLIARAETTEDRLKTIFRCSNLGYNNISELDINVFSKLVLQPLYDKHRFFNRMDGTRLNKVAKVLASFGIAEQEIWNTFHAWMKFKSAEEVRQANSEDFVKPLTSDLKGWLRFHYTKYYCDDETNGSVVKPIKPTYERLKTVVESGDSTALSSFINSYGWPDDTNFEEIVPDILNLYLEHEEWSNIKKLLSSLASKSSLWLNEDKPLYSPIRNYHLLYVLRRLSKEGDNITINDMINYSYELKRMFPFANASYSTFQDTQYQYGRLFFSCFDKVKKPTAQNIDDCIELLHTLIKLDMVSLHPTETLTNVFVTHVLRHLGWDDAVHTWLKFQTSLSCSNGIVALLKGCSTKDPNKPTDMKQYVLHKAQNFMTASRVHALHAAVLISVNRLTEAESLFSKDQILPNDLCFAFKLMNAINFRHVNEKFIYNFVEKCLECTTLATDAVEAKEIWSQCIRICTVKNLAPAALQIYELFKKHNIVLEDSEKLRISDLVERHRQLAQKWIYAPEGLLNITEDDPFVKESSFHKMQERLKEDTEGIEKIGKSAKNI